MTVDRTNLAVWQLEGCHEGKIWADMPASFRLKGFLVFQDFSVVNMWLYTLSSLFKKNIRGLRWFVYCKRICGKTLLVFTLTAEASSWRDEALTRCWVNFVQKKLQDTRSYMAEIVEGMAEIVRMGKCHMSGLDFGWFWDAYQVELKRQPFVQDWKCRTWHVDICWLDTTTSLIWNRGRNMRYLRRVTPC